MFSTFQKISLMSAIILASTLGCKESIAPRLGRTNPSTSHITQLTLEQYECHQYSANRIQEVKSFLPSGMLVGFGSSDLEDSALQALAGVPNKHLEQLKWAYDTNNFTISAEDPGFSGGLTQLGNPPEWIKISPDSYVVAYALQHEVGHAMHMMVSTGNFDSELATIADNNGNNKNLSQYAQGYVGQGDSYYYEFFAEAFNSYYCSQATNAEIKRDFPDAYEFLARYLAKPVWDEGGSSTQPNPNNGIKGLFAAIDPSNIMWASTSTQNVKEMAICMNDSNTCKNSLQRDMELKLFDTKSNGRMFFKGANVSNLQDGITITILGFNGQNLIESRSVTIQSN